MRGQKTVSMVRFPRYREGIVELTQTESRIRAIKLGESQPAGQYWKACLLDANDSVARTAQLKLLFRQGRARPHDKDENK